MVSMMYVLGDAMNEQILASLIYGGILTIELIIIGWLVEDSICLYRASRYKNEGGGSCTYSVTIVGNKLNINGITKE